MRSVTDLIDQLKSKYGGSLPFKRICADEGIVIAKSNLEVGLGGFYLTNGKIRLIVLNQNLSYWERRGRAWHELYHALRSPATNGTDRREEARADLFAALVMAPIVENGETIDTLQERYNVSARLARIRLEYENKHNGRG